MSDTAPNRPKQSDARRRVLETADRLFYAEGIHAVGIDRIIAEAGVAKMTLYNHFASKDDLIVAVLEHRERVVLDWFGGEIDKRRKKGVKPLDAFFATFKAWLKGPDFRGCAFINASVELADPSHPGAEFAAAHKKRFGRLIVDAIEAEGGDPTAARAIGLLIEGAIVTAVIEGSPRAADSAREAAAAPAWLSFFISCEYTDLSVYLSVPRPSPETNSRTSAESGRHHSRRVPPLFPRSRER